MTLELDPERSLALAYVPTARRLAMAALWRLDVTLGAVVATGRDPMISLIRLAWWREALERLDVAPPPAEPVLEGVAHHVLPAAVSGSELAAMEAGWSALLSAGPLGADELELHARARGAALFVHSARLLGHDDERIAPAGESWALVDLARRSGSPEDAARAVEAARARRQKGRWPVALRPLGMLAILAWRDADRPSAWERRGSPARVVRMVMHRLTGR